MELPWLPKGRKMAGVVICAINLSTEAAKTEDCVGLRASKHSLGYINYQASGFLFIFPLHNIDWTRR